MPMESGGAQAVDACRRARRLQRRLVLSWCAEFNPAWHAEGYSRVTFELEPQPHSVKLSVIHEIDRPDSQLVGPLS